MNNIEFSFIDELCIMPVEKTGKQNLKLKTPNLLIVEEWFLRHYYF